MRSVLSPVTRAIAGSLSRIDKHADRCPGARWRGEGRVYESRRHTDGRRLPPVRALTPDRSSARLARARSGKASLGSESHLCDFAICATSHNGSRARESIARRDAGCGYEASKGESLGYSSPSRSHDATATFENGRRRSAAGFPPRGGSSQRRAARSRRVVIAGSYPSIPFYFWYLCVFIQSPTAASARLKDSRRRAGPPER